MKTSEKRFLVSFSLSLMGFAIIFLNAELNKYGATSEGLNTAINVLGIGAACLGLGSIFRDVNQKQKQ